MGKFKIKWETTTPEGTKEGGLPEEWDEETVDEVIEGCNKRDTSGEVIYKKEEVKSEKD